MNLCCFYVKATIQVTLYKKKFIKWLMLIPAFEKNHFRKDPFFLNALPRVCVVDVTFPSKPAGECTNFTTAIVCDVQVFLVEQGNTKGPKRYYFGIVSRSRLSSRRSFVLILISQRRLRTLYWPFFVLFSFNDLWTHFDKNRELYCSWLRRKRTEAQVQEPAILEEDWDGVSGSTSVTT